MSVFEPPVSINLRKHGDSQLVFELMMLEIATIFWIAAKAKSGPVMPPSIYGEWVTSFDAEMWAGSIMLASFVFLAGIIINGDWRWSPALRFSGALWQVATLSAFCIGSLGAQYGDPVVMMCAGACSVHMWFVWLNLGDMLRAVRGKKE